MASAKPSQSFLFSLITFSCSSLLDTDVSLTDLTLLWKGTDPTFSYLHTQIQQFGIGLPTLGSVVPKLWAISKRTFSKTFTQDIRPYNKTSLWPVNGSIWIGYLFLLSNIVLWPVSIIVSKSAFVLESVGYFNKACQATASGDCCGLRSLRRNSDGKFCLGAVRKGKCKEQCWTMNPMGEPLFSVLFQRWSRGKPIKNLVFFFFLLRALNGETIQSMALLLILETFLLFPYCYWVYSPCLKLMSLRKEVKDWRGGTAFWVSSPPVSYLL